MSSEVMPPKHEPCDITPGVWCSACVPEWLRHMLDCETCESPNECAGYGVCANKSTVLSERRSPDGGQT